MRKPILNLSGQVLTPHCISIAIGMGLQAGEKCLIKGIGTPFRTKEEYEIRQRIYEWYGI